MKYLMENEMAFDDMCIGFPSIQGCHAIVFQASTGLYGYHNAGGSADADFSVRAQLFSRFVNGHGGGVTGTRLYGCSFIENNQRGYSGDTAKKWKEELVAFASALRFTGKISGYDLSKSYDNTTSAYVEYRAHGDKCDLLVRSFDRTNEHPHRIPNQHRLDYKAKSGHRTAPFLADLTTVVTAVSRANLTQVHKQKLR